MAVTPGGPDQLTAATNARDRPRAAMQRRRRAVAVIGVASILAGGGGLVALTQSSAGGTDVSGQNSTRITLPVNGERWAEQARVTLAALHEQLDLIAQAEAAWKATPASRRPGTPPVAVVALLQKKETLQQLQAILESQLATWESSQSARRSLNQTEAQLADIDRALQASQTGGPNTDQLIAQRAVLLHQRDMQREQLLGWDRGVERAVLTPLPEVDNAASNVVEPVLVLAQSPQPQPSPLPDAAYRVMPAAVPAQDRTGRTRQDVGVGAPPQPGLPPGGGSDGDGSHMIYGGEPAGSSSQDAEPMVLLAYASGYATDPPTPRRKPASKTPAAKAAAAKTTKPKPRAKKPTSNAAVPTTPTAATQKPSTRVTAAT